MFRLQLHFTSLAAPELMRTEFACNGFCSECVRGKTGEPHGVPGSFAWTAAVQAMTVLFLRAHGKGEECFPLSGSLASSLYFCLKKQPVWLREMFGTESTGRARLRRMISQTNGKDSSRITLSLRKYVRERLKLEVFVNEKEVTAREEIFRIADVIERRWRPHHSVSCEQSIVRRPALFAEAVAGEIEKGLHYSDDFSLQGIRTRIGSLYESRVFRSVIGKKARFQLDIDLLNIGASSWRQIVAEGAGAALTEPLRVAVTRVPTAASALFYYMRDVMGLSMIEIDESYAHSPELVAAAESQSFTVEPDLFIVGIGSAARLIGRQKREGLMLLPKHFGSFLAPKIPSGSAKKLLCYSAVPSSDTFVVESLRERGDALLSALETEHADPLRALRALQEGDPEALTLLFFPYSWTHLMQANCAELAHPKMAASVDYVAVARQELLRDKALTRRVYALIRYAWFKMLSDRSGVRDVAHSIATNRAYVQTIEKISGCGAALC